MRFGRYLNTENAGRLDRSLTMFATVFQLLRCLATHPQLNENLFEPTSVTDAAQGGKRLSLQELLQQVYKKVSKTSSSKQAKKTRTKKVFKSHTLFQWYGGARVVVCACVCVCVCVCLCV